MKSIVTGGAGFIGSHIVDALIKEGHEVIIIDNLSTGKLENINEKAKLIEADILDINSIKEAFEGADYVFHCAALARIQPSIKDPALTILNNVMGTTNVLICARDAKVKRVIYSASSSAYGNNQIPFEEGMKIDLKNPYSFSKYAGEELCKMFSTLYGMETVCLRYFNVYGPRQILEGAYASVIGIFIRQINNKEKVTIVGDGTIRRDFTNVKDIVRANLLAMSSPKVGAREVINIGTGVNYSINELADMIFHQMTGAGLADALRWEKATYIPPWPGEARATLADNKFAKEALGWEPTISLEEGIKELCTS